MSFPSYNTSRVITAREAAVYAKIIWTNGVSVITPSWQPLQWPTLAYLNNATVGVSANQTVTGDVLNISTTGNRTTRIFGNTAIDEMMRLDKFTANNTFKFVATRLWRDTVTTPMVPPTHERVIQYGASGVSSATDGGMVLRINSNNTQGVTNCLVPALHYPFGKPNGASDDLVISSSRAMNAVNGAYTQATGHFMCFATQKNANGPHAAIHLWTDDDALITTTAAHATPLALPGPSIDTPTGDTDSGGFTLFAQSVNSGAAKLFDCDVWPMWIGEARDMAHMLALITNLKADINANPY